MNVAPRSPSQFDPTTQFQTNTALDNISYNARGSMNWVVGSNWDGDLGATFTQNLGSFADVRTNQKNLRTAQSFYGSAMYRVYYDWKLRAALTQTTLENGAVAFRGGNREDTTLEVDERIDRIAERSMELLGGEAQQTVLQILARKPLWSESDSRPPK